MDRTEKRPFAVEFILILWKRLHEHDIITFSASLSFYMLLSFIPLAVIGTAIVGDIAGTADGAVEQMSGWIKELFPFMTGRMESTVQGLIKNRGLFGGIGIFALIWSAHMVLAEGEKVIRKVFGVHKKRWLILSYFIAWGIFLAAMIFFTASFIIGLYLRLAGDQLLPQKLILLLSPVINVFVVKYIPAVMVALVVTAAYKFLPQRKVPLLTAVIGGTFFAVLWEVAKVLFFIYVKKAAYLSIIYGSLGALMMFLLFVYYSALLFIIIAELVACTLDVRETVRNRQEAT